METSSEDLDDDDDDDDVDGDDDMDDPLAKEYALFKVTFSKFHFISKKGNGKRIQGIQENNPISFLLM